MIKAALIGNPVGHSLSPRLHNFWCEKHDISGSYEAISLDEKDLDSFLERLRCGEFVGANVTVPHKQNIFAKMDLLDNVAKKTGAVNIIVTKARGVLEGRNSDPEGFVENLLFEAPDFNFQNTPAVVLGAGGAARACIYGLLEKGARDIVVVGRSENKLTQLTDFYASPFLRGASMESINPYLAKAGLLVNATPVAPGVDFSALPTDAVVYDLVYTPPETKFLAGAKKHGLKTVGGLGMLIRQAVPAFETWFGVRPAFSDEIYNVLKAHKNRRKV